MTTVQLPPCSGGRMSGFFPFALLLAAGSAGWTLVGSGVHADPFPELVHDFSEAARGEVSLRASCNLFPLWSNFLRPLPPFLVLL